MSAALAFEVNDGRKTNQPITLGLTEYRRIKTALANDAGIACP